MKQQRRRMILAIIFFFSVFYGVMAIIETMTGSFATPEEALAAAEVSASADYTLEYNKDRTVAAIFTKDSVNIIRKGRFGWKHSFGDNRPQDYVTVIENDGNSKLLYAKVNEGTDKVSLNDEEAKVFKTKDGAGYWILFDLPETFEEMESLPVSYFDEEGKIVDQYEVDFLE
ncbi:hypothetical protein [Jeotgalibacillus campisalis]|uniref:Uncharacterized protein n=1 Tax=Jeotgalibacillus campisalis TaxID=220754 RepID=A0A0C2W802_9BACL|nr:hypothetical protein [Jeotgalibacillus campisalis]KIL52711.1 hypothetical protein KR50_00400 [Jeotgalibacillus campisalis]